MKMRARLAQFLGSLIVALIALTFIPVPNPISVIDAQAEAQTCSRIVVRALDAIDESCSDLGRNNACYGARNVQTTFNAPQPDDFFSDVGHRAPVRDMQSLRASPLDMMAGEWGIAVLSVQADLPNTLPGQNAIFLLLGDTEIESATPSSMARAEDDTRTLSSSNEPTGISAFYLRTGVGQPTCAQAPNALIIQGPENTRLQLTVNSTLIEFGSTIVLRTIPFTDTDLQALQMANIDPASLGETLQIAVLDGEAVVNVDRASPQSIRAGEASTICLEAGQNLGIDGQMDDMPVTDVCGGWTASRPMTLDEIQTFAGLEGRILNYAITMPSLAVPVVDVTPTPYRSLLSELFGAGPLVTVVETADDFAAPPSVQPTSPPNIPAPLPPPPPPPPPSDNDGDDNNGHGNDDDDDDDDNPGRGNGNGRGGDDEDDDDDDD